MGNCISSKQKEQIITISENALIDLLSVLEPNEQIAKIAQLLLTETNKKNQVALNSIASRIADAPLAPPKLVRQTNMEQLQDLGGLP